MPSTKGSGILGKQGELAGYMTRLKAEEAKGHFLKLLKKYSISLDDFENDLEDLSKVNSKASSEIGKLADALKTFQGIDIKAKGSNEKLSKQLDITEKKLEKWSEKFDKVKGFVTDHVGEISAAALGIQGIKASFEALDAATDTLVQTTGKLGDNWDSAATNAYDMSAQLLDVQIASSGLVKDIGELTEVQRKYYALFRGGGDAAKSIQGMASLQHAFGTDMSEMSEFMEQRQRKFNQTAEESTMELAGIHSEFGKLYEGIEKTGTAAQKSARIWEKDWYQVIKSAAGEINEAGTDMHALSKIMKGAADFANKLNLTMDQSKDLMSDVGKLFKLPEIAKIKGADEIMGEFVKARKMGFKEEDLFYKSYFKESDLPMAKNLMKQMERGEITKGVGAELLFDMVSKTGRGAAKTLALQKDFLQNTAVTADHRLAIMKEMNIKSPYVVENLLQSGKFDEMIKGLEVSGDKDPKVVAEKISGMNEEDRKKSAEDLEKLRIDAEQTNKKVTGTLQALIQNPITSILASVGLFAASTLLRRVQNKMIIGFLGSQDLALKAIQAASGVTPGPSPGGPGEQLGLLDKLDKGKAVVETGGGGDPGLDLAGKGKAAVETGKKAGRFSRFKGKIGGLFRGKEAVEAAAQLSPGLKKAGMFARMAKGATGLAKGAGGRFARIAKGAAGLAGGILTRVTGVAGSVTEVTKVAGSIVEKATKAAGKITTEAAKAASIITTQAAKTVGALATKAAGALEATTKAAPQALKVLQSVGGGSKSLVKGGLKVLGRAAGPLTAAFGVYEAYEAYKEGGVKAAVTKGAGALGGLGGGVLGAAIGTAIFPGVGTVVGGLLGAWLGSKGTEVLAEKVADAVSDDKPEDKPQMVQVQELGSMTKNAEVLVTQMKQMGLDNPEALAAATMQARRQQVGPDGLPVESYAPQDMKIKAKAKSIGPNGNLILQWDNPEVVATLYQVFTNAHKRTG